jgi:hypothetical protein
MKPQKISENGFEKQENMQQETPEKKSGFSAIMLCYQRKLWQTNCQNAEAVFSNPLKSTIILTFLPGTSLDRDTAVHKQKYKKEIQQC